jgi:hypothetical protein
MTGAIPPFTRGPHDIMGKIPSLPWLAFAFFGAGSLTLAVSPPRSRADGPAGKAADRAPSFPRAAEAEAFVNRFDRRELVRDEVFVKVLQELARSDLSPQAKADAFALMQERIGWLFVGAARLFPRCGYAQTVAMMLSTYFQYQQKMPAGLDVGPLLELARTARGEHPLRASNALLLATILNPKAAKEAVDKAVDAGAIAKAPVPAIDLHNLAFAAALTAEPKAVGRLLALLPETTSEESREDVMAVTSIYQVAELRDPIEAFVRKSFPASFDQSVQTALSVLAHAGPPDHFRDFYKSLGDLTKNPDDIETLRKFWDSGVRDRLQSDDPAQSPLKIWDGFTVKLENEEGGWISYGSSFRYWISFK